MGDDGEDRAVLQLIFQCQHLQQQQLRICKEAADVRDGPDWEHSSLPPAEPVKVPFRSVCHASELPRPSSIGHNSWLCSVVNRIDEYCLRLPLHYSALSGMFSDINIRINDDLMPILFG